jgi:hypothetical protein
MIYESRFLFPFSFQFQQISKPVQLGFLRCRRSGFSPQLLSGLELGKVFRKVYPHRHWSNIEIRDEDLGLVQFRGTV